LPKIIKIGGNLTKFWQKQFAQFFETRCIQSISTPIAVISLHGQDCGTLELHQQQKQKLFGCAEADLTAIDVR